MAEWHDEKMERLYRAFLTLDNVDEVKALFDDICTIKEVQEMSRRLQVADMIKNGCSYTEIGRATGVSTTTISRISRCVEYGSGGYRIVLDRLEEADGKDADSSAADGKDADSSAVDGNDVDATQIPDGD